MATSKMVECEICALQVRARGLHAHMGQKHDIVGKSTLCDPVSPREFTAKLPWRRGVSVAGFSTIYHLYNN